MAQIKDQVKIQTFFDSFVNKWGEEDKQTEFRDELMTLFHSTNVELAKFNIKTGYVDSQQEILIKEMRNMCKKFEDIGLPKPKVSTLGNFSSAAAKQMAMDNALNEKDLEGTGKLGKITVKDIKIHIGPSKTKKTKQENVEKHICSGILSKSGYSCKRPGKSYVEETKEWFCHSHITTYNEEQEIKNTVQDEEDIESIASGDIELNSDEKNEENCSENENSEEEDNGLESQDEEDNGLESPDEEEYN
jgi:hypothetical protein